MCEMSKLSIRLGGSGRPSADSQRVGNGLGAWLQHAETLHEGMLGVLFHELQERVFLSALRVQNFDAMPGRFGQDVFEQRAIFEIDGCVNVARQITGFEIELLQQGRQKLRGIELAEIFPIEVAPINDSPAAQVEQIHGHLRRFGVPGEDVGVVAFGRGDLLALFHFSERAQQIAIAAGLLVALLLRGALHALLQTAREIVASPFEK